jgi:hypothetical protein
MVGPSSQRPSGRLHGTGRPASGPTTGACAAWPRPGRGCRRQAVPLAAIDTAAASASAQIGLRW